LKNDFRKWSFYTFIFPCSFFNLRTAAFKAYYAIWVRRSNFRHQASPRVSPRESTQRRKVKLWAKNVREFCLNADFHVTFRDLLHAVKLRHGTDGFASPPKEGVLRIFFALKMRRLRPGANPRTWVPKASTLPLDHRSRLFLVCFANKSSCDFSHRLDDVYLNTIFGFISKPFKHLIWTHVVIYITNIMMSLGT